MSIVTRTTAKSYFETGDKPTQAQFIDFIDSARFDEDYRAFGKVIASANTTASAQNLLGIPGINSPGTLGNILFADNTTASAQSHLGIPGINIPGTVGNVVFAANTTASAQNNIGGGAVGKIIFEATTTASAVNQLGLPASGSVIQIVNTQTGAVATGTTVMPFDDTVPQNTEGDQYMTLSITPTNSSNKLLIQAICYLEGSVAGVNTAAIFQDSTVGALIAGQSKSISAVGNPGGIPLMYYMTAGTTSPTTFKLRGGLSTAGTTTFNGSGAARLYGGVYISSITITEIKA